MNYIIKDISSQPFGTIKINDINFSYISENSSRKDFFDKEKHIVNHWTAGNRKNLYDGYHFNVTEINNQIYVFKTLKRKEKGQHIWGRNSGAIGNTMCCMSTKSDFPTANMIEALSILNAEQCAWYGLDIEKEIILPKKQRIDYDSLITVAWQIKAPVISDHSYFAKKDGYSQERWDIGSYIETITNKAIQYHKELKENKREFIFKEIIK